MTASKITVDDTDVVGALSRLLAAAGDTRGALLNVGEALTASTKQRIRDEVSPDGTKFKALNPLYAKFEKKGPGILRGASGEVGGLSDIVYQLGGEGESVEVGNNVVYGAIHQFGGTIVPKTADALMFSLGGKTVQVASVTIPARPYLGISDADRAEVLAIFEDFIIEAGEGGIEN